MYKFHVPFLICVTPKVLRTDDKRQRQRHRTDGLLFMFPEAIKCKYQSKYGDENVFAITKLTLYFAYWVSNTKQNLVLYTLHCS